MSDATAITNYEEPKRLAPKQDVLRELFLKSGNLCAFPSCHHLIMDADGSFVGQICHIEAAEKDGERFNPAQTNEQRRSLENLVLLCYDHHIKTNDVDAFPVGRMQQIKADHEKKVNDFVSHLQLKVMDLTKLDAAKPATLARALVATWGISLTDEELKVTADDLNGLLSRLKELPRPAREFLKVAVLRSREDRFTSVRRFFLPHELEMACGLDQKTVLQLLAILDERGFVFNVGEDEYGNSLYAVVAPGCDWSVWGEFLAFQETGRATLEELIVNLNFSLLD